MGNHLGLHKGDLNGDVTLLARWPKTEIPLCIKPLHRHIHVYPCKSKSLSYYSQTNQFVNVFKLKKTEKGWQENTNLVTDTPQFCGGNPYFFAENPYQSVSFIYASMYRENVHAIHIAMQFAKKSRHCVIEIDSQQQRTKIGPLFHVARQSDLGLRLWLTRSIVLHRRRNLPFFRNLAEKASCVDDKTVLFRYTYSKLFFSNLPQIRITTWYGRFISKKAKIRIGYGQSVPGGMSAGQRDLERQ